MNMIKVKDINWYIKENNISKDVTELDCSNSELVSLKGIEQLTSLTTLYCYNNNLTTLNGIECLTSLTTLYCYNNNLPYDIDNLSIKEIQIKVKKEVRKDKINKILNRQK